MNDFALHELTLALSTILATDITFECGPLLTSAEMQRLGLPLPNEPLSTHRQMEKYSAWYYASAALNKLQSRENSHQRIFFNYPLWPDEYVGSVTHTRSVCVSMAAKATSYLALGIDLEELQKLDHEVIEAVLTKKEIKAHRKFEELIDLAILYFCAKEAAYKAVCSKTKLFLDFHDFEVEVVSDNTLTITLPQHSSFLLRGKYTKTSKFMCVCTWLEYKN